MKRSKLIALLSALLASVLLLAACPRAGRASRRICVGNRI